MTHYFLDKIRSYVISLRASMLTIFVTLFVLTILLLSTITYVRFSNTLTYITEKLMEKSSAAVHYEILQGMNEAVKAITFNTLLMNEGIINVRDKNEVSFFIFNLAKAISIAQAILWADENGTFISVQKTPTGVINSINIDRSVIPAIQTTIYRNKNNEIINQTYLKNPAYNPHQSLWYVTAKKNKKLMWIGSYVYKIDREAGISLASPVFQKDGSFLGTLDFQMSLDFLSRYLISQRPSPNGVTFIVRSDGKLIAHPKLIEYQEKPTSRINLVDIHVFPVIAKSFDIYQKTKQKSFLFSHAGKNYISSYKPVEALSFRGWLIGVTVPEDDYIGQLRYVHLINLIISFSILIIGLVIVSSLVTRTVRPLKKLTEETEKIKHFDLSGKSIISSRIREIKSLADGIAAMKSGLKSFQRYVPQMLVRQLIETGEDAKLNASKKNLVVWFSDIKDFTAIAEKMDPPQLLEQICDYFDEVSKVIVTENGTIDKYIGDSIMAFWGAPLSLGNDCLHAAKAALLSSHRINELNKRWNELGQPSFITRIGIHAGTALVGNLGSSERLNYTALGDTVNIASRLEALNKIYGSHIIVTRSVYDEIKNHFQLRILDCVTVKGKYKSIFLYELLAQNNETLSFNLTEYDAAFVKGFNYYQHQEWENAISSFETCLSIYPTDTLTPVFIKRCHHFKLNPEPDWDGIWHLENK